MRKRASSIWLLFILLSSVFYSLPVSGATYTYDNLNRLTSVTYDNGQKITYTYDAGGNILSVNGVTSQDSLQISPNNVIESNTFSQIFTITLTSGNFIDGVNSSNITLGGDFTGLAKGDVARTAPNSMTVALSGTLHKSIGTGNISISAAGTNTGKDITANVIVNSAQQPAADLSGLSVKEGADGTGKELISNFDPANLNISLQTASDVVAVKILATPAIGTTITLYQGSNKITDGVINLNNGLNSIQIVVSEDNKANKTYNVTITLGQIDECFIATAAFGSKFTWPVTLLRHFRDQYLLTHTWGTAFVNFYYRYSPPIAAFIAGSEPLKMLVRVSLAPVIALVYLLYHPILMITFLILFIILLVFHYIVRRKYVQA